MELSDFEKAKKIGLGISYAKAFFSILFDFIICFLAITQVESIYFSGFVIVVLFFRIRAFAKKDFKGELEKKSALIKETENIVEVEVK